MSEKTIFFTGIKSEHTIVLNGNESEVLIDLLTKHDCYGLSAAMIETIGSLRNFFNDTEEQGATCETVKFTNNGAMVLYSIASELITIASAKCRMTHAGILYMRKQNRENKSIGRNRRADIIYTEVSVLGKFLGIISLLILADDGLMVRQVD